MPNTLSPEARKARNEYLRKWRKRNPDKVKYYSDNYWERKAALDNAQEPDATTAEN